MNARPLALLLLALSLACAAAGSPVALGPAAQRNASIAGDLVAWDDDRGGDRDVYVRNLVTGAETRVGSPGTDETEPDLDGARVVYASGGDVLLFDLGSGVTTTVCAAPGAQERPRIAGERVVWEDRRGPDADVYLFDLRTGVETRLTGAGNQHSPAIDGALVAWIADGPAPGEGTIVTLDAASGATYLVAAGVGLAAPDLGGGAVTYLASDGGGRRTYRAAVTGGAILPIVAVPGEHAAQRIDGARVAVEAGGEIWVYAMNFGTATRLAAGRDPAIDGTRVAWEADGDVHVANADGGSVGVPATVPPTVAPTATAPRFGTRRYIVGDVPKNPPAGVASAGAGTIGPARPRAVVGAGTATGTAPPASRFVRWSPLERWRSGLR